MKYMVPHLVGLPEICSQLIKQIIRNLAWCEFSPNQSKRMGLRDLPTRAFIYSIIKIWYIQAACLGRGSSWPVFVKFTPTSSLLMMVHLNTAHISHHLIIHHWLDWQWPIQPNSKPSKCMH